MRVATLAVFVVLCVIASACGGSGSSGEGVARVDTTGTTTTTGSNARNGSSTPNPAAYSDCMRKNGVPSFPDPDSKGRVRIEGDAGFDPDSAQFQAAARACERFAAPALSPAQRAEFREQLLAFSACMRRNGVPTFPDPVFERDGSGGISIPRGIDEDSPQFKNAEETCEKRIPDPTSRAGEGGTP